jgi:hypothetical protein
MEMNNTLLSGGVTMTASVSSLAQQARVHGQLAIQICEVMQTNVQLREILRDRLRNAEADNVRALRPRNSYVSAAARNSPASLRDRIRQLDRDIERQMAVVDHHLRESRRLRELAHHDVRLHGV